MAIERLEFNKNSKYNASELAIHLARYSVVQRICQGCNVLDIACGEGYGTFAMASFWGAHSVKGVDLSEDAIKNARNRFSHPNIEYITYSAEKVDELFERESFDLIISLETIEHVDDPYRFLSAIKQLLKPSGVAVISCPNDHWYYGPNESKNPFHRRNYYFEEFKEFSQNILGKAGCFLLGQPITGFGNFFLSDRKKLSERSMLAGFNKIETAKSNYIDSEEHVSAEVSAYFVGVWGDLKDKKELINTTFYPISMDRYALLFDESQKAYKKRIKWLEGSLNSFQKWSEELKNGLKESDSKIVKLTTWANDLQLALEWAEKNKQSLEENTQNLKLQLDTIGRNLEESKKLNKDKEIEIFRLIEEIKLKDLQIDRNKSEVDNLLESLKQKDSQLTSVQDNLKESENILENANQTIILMKASRFWKLRNQWFRFKSFLDFNKHK